MIITISRKPFKGSLIDNVQNESCGGLNINATRIGTEGGRTNKGGYQDTFVGGTVDYTTKGVDNDHTPRGRWGANFLLDASGVSILDQQSGETKGTVRKPTGKSIYPTEGSSVVWNNNNVKDTTVRGFSDDGGASRYFFIVGGSDEESK